MASRTMHLAVSSLIASDISVRDAGRFKFGVILPDAEDGRYGDLTHFKTTDADGKKLFKTLRLTNAASYLAGLAMFF